MLQLSKSRHIPIFHLKDRGEGSTNPNIKTPLHFSGAAKNSIPPKRKERCNDIPISLYSKKPKKKKDRRIERFEKVFPPRAKLQFVLDIGCVQPTILLDQSAEWNGTQQPAAANQSVRGCQQVAGWPRIDFLRIQPGSQLLLLPSKTALNLSCLATYLLQTLSSHPVGGRVSREGHIWRRWK